MVRNLVLTPFIDLPCPHFMFCGKKMTEFFKLRDAPATEAQSCTTWINFSPFAPISLLMDATEGKHA